DALLERYAELIVGTGANVQADQIVAVEACLEAAPLVHAIARAAYARDARYVDVLYWDPQVKRIRAEIAREKTLSYVPPWLRPRRGARAPTSSTRPAPVSTRSGSTHCTSRGRART